MNLFKILFIKSIIKEIKNNNERVITNEEENKVFN